MGGRLLLAALPGAAAVAAGADPAVPAAVRSRLGLSRLGRRAAPGGRLVDRRGRSVSLAALRGRVVVLELFDPVCTDICPIVSQEYLEANRLLSARSLAAPRSSP